ncbi:MAG: PAS domain S-box protein [Rhodocyclaceae bacterium]|nr:PAS domain S-box protein [Rhodocyclaceae bacterium]
MNTASGKDSAPSAASMRADHGPRDEPVALGRRARGSRRPGVLAAACLVLGAGLAGIAYLLVEQGNRDELRQRFSQVAREESGHLHRQISAYEYGLRGVRGAIVVASPERITREQFLRYVASRDTATEFPGARGMGFIRRVSAQDEADFIARARADGWPDFSVRLLAPHDDERFIIQYIEPVSANRQAVGLDIGSESNRRSAAIEAAQENRATLSRPITLVQADGATNAGFLLMLPVYDLDPRGLTVAERWDATRGWSYAPLVIQEVLKSFEHKAGDFQLELSDLANDGLPHAFYRSPPLPDQVLPSTRERIPIELFGRTWIATFTSTDQFVESLNLVTPIRRAGEVFVVAALVSGVVFGALVSLQRRREVSIEQEKLAAIVESANDAIIGKDLDGRVMSWNPAAEGIFGFTAAEAVGRRIADLIVPADRLEEERAILERIARGSVVPHFETVRLAKSGEARDVAVTVSPIRDDAGRIVGAAKTVRDIGAEKRSEARFRLAVEASPNGMLMVDAAGRIALVNQQIETLFGYPRADLLGRPIEMLVPERYRGGHGGQIRGYFATGGQLFAQGREFTGLRADGTELPVEIGLTPLATPDGQFALAAIVDLRERRRHETELRRVVTRLKLAVGAARIGIWVWELEADRILWDRQMYAHFGFPVPAGADEFAALTPDRWRTRIHPEDAAGVAGQLAELARQRDADCQFAFRIVLDDAAVRHLSVAATQEPVGAGEAPRIVGICHDISDEVATRERMLALNADLERQVAERTASLHEAMEVANRANRAKSDFLSNMSHEIRTPLNAVLGMAYLLERQSLPQVAAGMVDSIHCSGRALLGVINDILDFSKIEAGKLDLEMAPFQLSTVLEDLAGIARSSVGGKAVEIIIGPAPPGTGTLLGDRVRLGQILINLVSNAIKFTEAGEITVLAEPLEGDPGAGRVALRFSVRDTGIGIEADKLGQIFEAFAQADSSITRVFGGTGLGLAISRHLASLMGGTLSVDSRPGAGSTFRFELVFERAADEFSPVDPLPRVAVLVADDHPVSLDMLTRTLESLGCDVTTARSGSEAEAALLARRDRPFDALVLDWKMPGLDGLEVIERLEQRRQGTQRMPAIVMVTAHDRSLLEAEPGAQFANAVLSKPVTASDLHNALSRLLGRGRDFVDTFDANALGGLRLLVVDDSDINREVAYRAFRAHGAQVHLASHGQEALDWLRARKGDVDLVLMDVQMPILDGYSATREIRADPVLATLPVIALSAGAFVNQREAAAEAGMNDFIAKPIEMPVAIRTILSVLGRDAVPGGPPTSASATRGDGALPGFDLAGALARWDDEAVLRRFLRKFAAEHADFVDQLDPGDSAGSQAVLHRLAGAAANLGLTEVAVEARALETTCAAGTPGQPALNNLRRAIAIAIDAIDRYAGLSPGQAPAIESPGETAAPTASSLREALVALRRNDPAPAEALLARPVAAWSSQSREALQAALDDFDFDTAADIVQAILTEQHDTETF